jgi:hypothetical protein
MVFLAIYERDGATSKNWAKWKVSMDSQSRENSEIEV